MSDQLKKEGSEPELPVWPPESQPDFDLIILPDEPFRIIREWERNKRDRSEASELQAIKRLRHLIKLRIKVSDLKEIGRSVATEVVAKSLVEWASHAGVPIEFVMSVIKNLLS